MLLRSLQNQTFRLCWNLYSVFRLILFGFFYRFCCCLLRLRVRQLRIVMTRVGTHIAFHLTEGRFGSSLPPRLAHSLLLSCHFYLLQNFQLVTEWNSKLIQVCVTQFKYRFLIVDAILNKLNDVLL